MPSWTGSNHGVDWRLDLERDRMLPGRLAAGTVEVVARNGFDARGAIVALRAVEHWKHEVHDTDSEGRTTSRTVTERAELREVPVRLDGEVRLARGERRSWPFELPVPPLGPATLEADVAGLDWTVEAKLDVPGGLDSSIEVPVRVLQPVALLRAGAVPVGQFGLFGSADVGADGVTGSVELEPVPLCPGEPFSARIRLAGGDGRRLQEIRLELRVEVEATVPNGHRETITAWAGSIAATELADDRTFEVADTIPDRAVPSLVLPHGKTAAEFHVILATAWARDPHLSRDVAIATTLEL